MRERAVLVMLVDAIRFDSAQKEERHAARQSQVCTQPWMLRVGRHDAQYDATHDRPQREHHVEHRDNLQRTHILRRTATDDESLLNCAPSSWRAVARADNILLTSN